MQPYVELHAHSYYSLLDGVSSPAKLVEQAAHLGMPALALTDHDNLYGALVFAEAAEAAGIKPIFGSEMTLEDGNHLMLLVRNEQGWANLCQMISLAQANAPKGQAALPLSALENYYGTSLSAPPSARRACAILSSPAQPSFARDARGILFHLKVARDLSGFTAAQGELLCRALGKKMPPMRLPDSKANGTPL